MDPVPLRRLPVILRPDPARVLVRPFLPAGQPCPPGEQRAEGDDGSMPHPRPVLPAIEAGRAGPGGAGEPCRLTRVRSAVMAMEPARAEAELAEVMQSFGDRHDNLEAVFGERFLQVSALAGGLAGGEAGGEAAAVPDRVRRLLIGAYFSLEYSYQAAALFNPSLVPHPDQAGLAPGELRFVLSLRATGEGHISSICFRSGVVDAGGEVRMDPPGERAIIPEWNSPIQPDGACEVGFPPTSKLADRVLFPITPKQSGGLEDARFVRFTEEDGSVAYYATYTAYSGHDIAPELLRTEDFERFRFIPLEGAAVRNKGMALFPRRVGGQYATLARVDGESVQLARSDDLRRWERAETVLRPVQSWELVQMGNCGSPIELPEGWLVLTHGVGAMRRYCLGAALLDLNDPAKVLGRLRAPLLGPDESEREGYVPNVVYSCGAAVHAGNLVLPYAMSDSASGFATVPVRELLRAMG